jgi:hypothetical protein
VTGKRAEGARPAAAVGEARGQLLLASAFFPLTWSARRLEGEGEARRESGGKEAAEHGGWQQRESTGDCGGLGSRRQRRARRRSGGA